MNLHSQDVSIENRRAPVGFALYSRPEVWFATYIVQRRCRCRMTHFSLPPALQ